ncbi:MAG: ATP-grasp domain-containing protein [Muribaculaceae bacterium]|nr:ATP-grasp domain-containing protein [Muribaculaceae bacterium]
MNIFFTCAGRRTYLLKYFKEQLANNGLIIGGDMQLTAPALSVADIAVELPAVYADDYVDILLEVCKQYNVRLLISLNDLELPILANQKHRFMEIGTIVVVSSPEVVEICFDKVKTAEFIEKLGLKAPKTFVNLDDAMESIRRKELQFPLILKPRWGSGSIGIEIVYDKDELLMVYKLLLHKVKKSILATASQGNEYIMIQQLIKGNEFGLDVMNDLNGNHVAVSVKQKLAMRAGETDKAITINNPAIREIGAKIGNALKHIGNLDCDVLEEDGEYYVLELNPRFGGGFPFSYEAGVNLPGALISWAKGERFDIAELQPRYGETFAKCDVLIKR